MGHERERGTSRIPRFCLWHLEGRDGKAMGVAGAEMSRTHPRLTRKEVLLLSGAHSAEWLLCEAPDRARRLRAALVTPTA